MGWIVKNFLALMFLFAFFHGVSAQDSAPAPEKPTAETPASKSTSSYGDPVTMEVPRSVKEAIRDQGVAITRLSLEFEKREAKDGISLEYEGMRTESPVIFAAFIGEKCDQELSYKDWLARIWRGIDLAFIVKTMPQKLPGLSVAIEHLHMKGEVETLQSTFKATDAKVGEPYSVRLRGVKPGINRYRLVVSYKNDKGEITSAHGFSHWLVVQAPPMFEFSTEPSCVATYTSAGASTVIRSETTLTSSFMLHGGLSLNDCELRVIRRGKREVRLESLAPEVRRVVGSDTQPSGWEEVGRCRLGASSADWIVLSQDAAGFVKLSYTHSLSITSDVLPLNENWDYQFELRHLNAREPLAVWSMTVTLNIARAEDLAKARVVVSATGHAKPLEVPFSRK